MSPHPPHSIPSEQRTLEEVTNSWRTKNGFVALGGGALALISIGGVYGQGTARFKHYNQLIRQADCASQTCAPLYEKRTEALAQSGVGVVGFVVGAYVAYHAMRNILKNKSS